MTRRAVTAESLARFLAESPVGDPIEVPWDELEPSRREGMVQHAAGLLEDARSELWFPTDIGVVGDHDPGTMLVATMRADYILLPGDGDPIVATMLGDSAGEYVPSVFQAEGMLGFLRRAVWHDTPEV